MRSLRKILISSLVLIAIGILGLTITLFVGNFTAGLSNFGAGQGYTFCSEDMGHMIRGFFQSEEVVDLSFKEVEDITDEYLKRNNLSNLEVKEIMEFSKNFYIEVVEAGTGLGAMELLVDKSSGAIFPEYGPNMMWNLKYGMYSRLPLSQNKIDMPIDEEKATRLAKRYLAKANIGEYVSDDIEKFYGYYTIHTLTEDGDIAGMLSVNGFSGQVWYHSWHGIFIDITEEH